MLRMKCGVVAAVSLIAWCLSVSAQTSALPTGLGAMYSLDQFGPVQTTTQADATLQKAMTDLIAAGGGVIVIPEQAPAEWVPKNNSQNVIRNPPPPAQTTSWKTGVGVTIIDGRGKAPKIVLPQVSGLEIDRTLDLPPGSSLGHWGYYPELTFNNVILRGSASYHDWLQEDVKAGKDQHFYVATVRGIFPGEFLNGLSWGGTTPRLCVKSIGYDKEKKMWYFIADVDQDVGKGTILSNKHHVNVLSMDTYSHTENQTFDVKMWRHNFSQGDNYLFDARFKYMSDVHSTAGDENGVLYAAFVEPILNVFRGKVVSWSPETGELKFSGDSGSTLGTGRPLINMNPAKWVTGGTVEIVQPANWTETNSGNEPNPVFEGKTYPTTIAKNRIAVGVLKMGGLIHFSKEAPITEDVVGRYFAVDEPSEYVPGAAKLRRWYLIDSVKKNADGTTDMQIIRHWWGAKSMGSPRLYKLENSTYDGHLRPLHYIIAPGANVYDVADAVENPKATMKIVPTPFTGTPVDFAANDPLEQAIGPDPFKPIPFRSWVWDAVPGAFPSPMFDIANNGQVMRDSLFWIHGGSQGSIELDRQKRYDGNPVWDKFFTFDAECNTGIKFSADTGNAAILFTQPNNRTQPIKWYYATDSNKVSKVASLSVSADTGDLNFTGGNLRINGTLVTTTGQAAEEPARNSRGVNVPVEAGQSSVSVKFASPEANDNYAVFIEQNWVGVRAVVKKDTTGFTVQFEKPAPASAKLDWMIVR